MINDVFGELRKQILAIWCVFTMFHLFWGYNPMRAPAKEIKRVEARYERLLADAQAKEGNARLMLNEQRENFEQLAKNFEEKHQTISQILKTSTSPGPALTQDSIRLNALNSTAPLLTLLI